MDDKQASFPQGEALVSLLDDPSPTVRKALLDYFTAQGAPAADFLKGLSKGKNRMVAWHARWFLTELKFNDPVAEFKGFIRSLHYELETGALLLGRTVYPEIDIGASCEELDAIAKRCRELLLDPSSDRETCRVINRVLFHEYGFRGNVENYTDPDNSFLHRVLERRKGIPISLSIVYLLVARRLGLELEPVGLPGHFMIGCYSGDLPFFIDAFEQGRLRDAEEIFDFLRARDLSPKLTDLAPTPIREVLCRCCRNLVNHYTAANDDARARLFGDFVNEFDATLERHSS